METRSKGGSVGLMSFAKKSICRLRILRFVSVEKRFGLYRIAELLLWVDVNRTHAISLGSRGSTIELHPLRDVVPRLRQASTPLNRTAIVAIRTAKLPIRRDAGRGAGAAGWMIIQGSGN